MSVIERAWKFQIFKFGVPCFVVKNLKAKFLGIGAIVRFWAINKRKLSHIIGRSDLYSGLIFKSEIRREPY